MPCTMLRGMTKNCEFCTPAGSCRPCGGSFVVAPAGPPVCLTLRGWDDRNLDVVGQATSALPNGYKIAIERVICRAFCRAILSATRARATGGIMGGEPLPNHASAVAYACYCDPERTVFLTEPRHEILSPSPMCAPKQASGGMKRHHQKCSRLFFDHPLCQLVLDLLKEAKETWLLPDRGLSHAGSLALVSAGRARIKRMCSRWKLVSKVRAPTIMDARTSGGLWQPRSYDHVLRREDRSIAAPSTSSTIPVRKGLCGALQDWPYSVRWDLLL